MPHAIRGVKRSRDRIKIHYGAGEMAQWAKALLCNPASQSLDPLSPHTVGSCNPNAPRAMGRGARTVSKLKEPACLRKTPSQTRWTEWTPRLSSDLHKCPTVHVCTHMNRKKKKKENSLWYVGKTSIFSFTNPYLKVSISYNYKYRQHIGFISTSDLLPIEPRHATSGHHSCYRHTEIQQPLFVISFQLPGQQHIKKY